LRSSVVKAANAAVRHYPFWKQEFERLEVHLERSQAIVAFTRKLLIVIWHLLMKEVVD
jgi:hypothetical protein